MATSGGTLGPTGATNASVPQANIVPAVVSLNDIFDVTSTTWRPWQSSRSIADTNAGADHPSIQPLAWDGAAGQRQRTPKVLKTVTATALGATALWTPAAGKKFRLMRLAVTLTANVSLAVAGLEEVTLLDSATDIGFGASWFVPAAAGAVFGEQSTGWLDLGNGVLSAVANNVLSINLGTALATGECRVFCVGTEE